MRRFLSSHSVKAHPEDFVAIAQKYGKPITFRRYRMWHRVPHIGNTALVVDVVVPRGGYRLIGYKQGLPPMITPEYAENAIRNNAFSLGALNCSNPDFDPIFIPWEKRVGNYPPGYFTHKVGDDVNCG